MKRWQWIVPVSLAAFALGGGVAWGTIPDAANVVHGCYKGSGDLRVVDTGTGGSCKPSETALAWSGVPTTVIRTTTQTIDPGAESTFTAFCNAGEVAVGGGWRLVGPIPVGPPPVTVDGSIPQSSSPEPSAGETPIAWKVVGAVNNDGVPHDVTVFAVCRAP